MFEDVEVRVVGDDVLSIVVIRTAAGERLQQTVGIKDDASHSHKGCACAPHPIAR